MSHYDNRIKSDQSGITLLELMFGVGIGSLVVWAAMSFFQNSQKTGDFTRIRQAGREEVANLAKLIERSWNVRNGSSTSPSTSFSLKRYFNGPSCTSDCGSLRLEARREAGGVKRTEIITIRNDCENTLGIHSKSKIDQLNIPSGMTPCGVGCSSGQVPIVRFESDFKNSSDIYPVNIRNKASFSQLGLLGLRVCFKKSTDFMEVDLYSYSFNQSQSNFEEQVHSITIPDENFGRIELHK